MINLDDGSLFNPYRSRSEGVLTRKEIDACRSYGIEIAYDSIQGGWVPSTCVEDINEVDESQHKVETLRQCFASRLATLRQASPGRDSALSSRRHAMELATEACLETLGSEDIELLERSHITLHQDIARFFPSPWSQGQMDEVDAAISYRPWQAADADTYAGILGNQRVWDYLPESWPGAITAETACSMIALANEGSHHQVQAVLVDGQIVGQVRLIFNQRVPGLRGAEVAYLLGEEHWGRGLMKQILRDFSSRIMRERRLDFLVAWIQPDNIGSGRAAARSGYDWVDCPWMEQAAAQAGRTGFERYMLFERDLKSAGSGFVTAPDRSEAAA